MEKKEAMKILKDFHDKSALFSVRTALDTVFPELKESEDERVKKELIELISCMHDADPRKKGWIAWLEKPSESDETKAKIFLINKGYPIDANGVFPTYEEMYNIIREGIEKQGEHNTFTVPQTPIKDAIEVTSRMQYISDDMKPIAEFIMGYANWNLHKDEWNEPTLTVPLFRVLDALIQRGKPYGECSQNIEKQGEKKPLSAAENLAKAVTDAHPTFNFKVGLPDEDECPKWFEKQGEKPHGKTALEAAKEEKVDNANKVEPKFKVKYAGNEYNVFETKDIAGVTFYGIEDEPNHIDYVKAENCEIISVYAIKENGSPYPTKPAVFSEKKPKRMISAEAKECIYGSDNEQVSSEKIGKSDTLLDLLHKMPSYITVDGIYYHFMLRKTAISYMAFYGGEGEGSGKVIFCMAGDPVDILTEMLKKLKEEGLLE